MYTMSTISKKSRSVQQQPEKLEQKGKCDHLLRNY